MNESSHLAGPDVALPVRVDYDARAVRHQVWGSVRVALLWLGLTAAAVVGWIVFHDSDYMVYLILIGVALGCLALAGLYAVIAWMAAVTLTRYGGWAWTIRDEGLELARAGLLAWDGIERLVVESPDGGAPGALLSVYLHDPQGLDRRVAHGGVRRVKDRPQLVRPVSPLTVPTDDALETLELAAGRHGIHVEFRSLA